MPASPPEPVAALAAELASLPGVVGVTLGGSRVTGRARADSDWDLAVFYRGRFDSDRVRGLGHTGHVSEPGDWGPLMNGGGWLTVSGLAVDVLFRDLDVVERWTAEAEAGHFEILAQNGYLAGAPTYVAPGELATAIVLQGELPHPGYPAALANAAPARWRERGALALTFADAHARGGDAVACGGMLSLATLCAAHAQLAGRGEWVVNEKRLVERAGFEPGRSPAAGELSEAVARAAAELEIEPLRLR